MSWLLQERLKQVAQLGKAIFFIICSNKKQNNHILWHTFLDALMIGKTTTQWWEQGELWYLFFSQAVERQFFLYAIARVDYQAGVCRAEGSQAGRWAVILKHKRKEKNVRCVMFKHRLILISNWSTKGLAGLFSHLRPFCALPHNKPIFFL